MIIMKKDIVEVVFNSSIKDDNDFDNFLNIGYNYIIYKKILFLYLIQLKLAMFPLNIVLK